MGGRGHADGHLPAARGGEGLSTQSCGRGQKNCHQGSWQMQPGCQLTGDGELGDQSDKWLLHVDLGHLGGGRTRVAVSQLRCRWQIARDGDR